MVVDLHVLEAENLVIRVAGYYIDRPLPPIRVPAGPFDDTEKILKFYPHPNPAMKFRDGESLRLAIPKMHLVSLARNEAEMPANWDTFQKSIVDPAFDIHETWPI